MNLSEEDYFLIFASSVQSELFNLLAHDLGHRALEIYSQLENIRDSARKSFYRSPGYDRLESLINLARESSSGINSIIKAINTIGSVGETVSQYFNVHDVIIDASNLFSDSFNRYNMCLSIEGAGRLQLFGHRSVFALVINNLIMNSIDAQKKKRNRRRNLVRIMFNAQSSDFSLQFQDQGPGINRSVFINPSDIFHIGATTKQSSMGIGLAISRDMFHRHFKGEIALVDPEHAVFRLRCPIIIKDE